MHSLKVSNQLGLEHLNLGTVWILFQIILVVSDCPVHYGVVSGIPGLPSLDSNSVSLPTPPAVGCDNQNCLADIAKCPMGYINPPWQVLLLSLCKALLEELYWPFCF